VKSQGTLRKILAFFRRDVAIARSYRMAFALEILEAFFGVATFYYLSRFVSNEQLALSLPPGRDYFAFALVGFAFFDYLTVSLSAFDSTITEAQQNGTLEAMLVTETPLTIILVASAAYPFVLLALRTVIYLAWGALLFHFPIREANWLGAATILVTSILAFAGLGIISTSYLLLFKRGNPARWLIVGAILTEAALIGAVGSVLGVAGGVGFAKLAASVLGDAYRSGFSTLAQNGLFISSTFVALNSSTIF